MVYNSKLDLGCVYGVCAITRSRRNQRWCRESPPILSPSWGSYYFPAPITRRQGRNSQYHFKPSGRRHHVCVTWDINISFGCHAGESWVITVPSTPSQTPFFFSFTLYCPSNFYRSLAWGSWQMKAETFSVIPCWMNKGQPSFQMIRPGIWEISFELQRCPWCLYYYFLSLFFLLSYSFISSPFSLAGTAASWTPDVWIN